jgi:hypothetical protein
LENRRNKIDRKTRKILTMYKMNHPKANIDTQYLKRREGRGLIQIEATYSYTAEILVHSRDTRTQQGYSYTAEITNTAEHLNTKHKNQFVNTVKSQESNQPNMNPTIKTAAKAVEELNQMRTVTQKGHTTQKKD